MPTIQVQVRRFSAVWSRPFEEIVRRLTATIGHPDMNAFHSAVAAAATVADLEAVVQGAIGSSDLMEFARFDAGEILRKGQGGQGPKILRLVVGNPLIMKKMARTVPDAAAYAPIGGKDVTDIFLSRNTHPSSSAGVPGISLPMGLNSEGLPLGLELDAAAGRDRDLLVLARAVEQVIGPLPGPWILSCGRRTVRMAARDRKLKESKQ